MSGQALTPVYGATHDHALARSAPPLPSFAETIAYLKDRRKRSVHELLVEADARGRLLIQPRCGVGAQDKMAELLQVLEHEARPDVLSLTIDAYTRLCQFDRADEILRDNPHQLNGYPLVCHGYQRVRELDQLVEAPIEIRHGSPDARLLFETSIAGGITAFEGGAIGYNVPYSKNVPIRASLDYWRHVDRRCGELAEHGIIVDRELFGTLTAVLMPPSISLAATLLEALCAVREGVRCISIACCQGGAIAQDVAALRAIRTLAHRYLPGVAVFPVLHQFMGAFPADRAAAEALILEGALAARKGRGIKVINKPFEEAFGVPTAQANALGIWTTRLANSRIADFVVLDQGEIDEETSWIVREVDEIVAPLVDRADLYAAIADAFEDGSLDVPFSASRYARGDVLPMRDRTGAIRYHHAGQLALSRDVLQRNADLLDHATSSPSFNMFDKLMKDIMHFANQQVPDSTTDVPV
jgi:methylaspartate mutase epsilon subunit